MPGGDRTGPTGHGAMSGRGLGYCGGFDAPGSGGARGGAGFLRGWMGGGRGGWGGGFGRGRGRGRGFGPGRGAGWGPGLGRGAESEGHPPDVGDEKEFLQRESKRLRARAEAIEKRLAELDEPE